MWLLSGLGNPGAKYLLTRHNVGFMAVDAFAATIGVPRFREEHQALLAKIKLEDQDVLLVKPMTYMNKSGESIREIMQFYKVEQSRLIVLHDEVDLGFGELKIQRNRGPGGHNGLKSINDCLASQDYIRIRIGVGRPENPQMELASHVLQNFTNQELENIKPQLEVIGDAIEALIFEGYDKAASRYSGATVSGSAKSGSATN